MNKACVSALAALVLASPLASQAESLEYSSTPSSYAPTFDDRWYITPFATYTWADENRNTDDGAGWGFGVGKPINEWLNLELRGTYTNLVTENPLDLTDEELEDKYNVLMKRGFHGTGDIEVGDIALDGLFFFNRGSVQPFLLAGLGAISDDFSCDRTPANVGFCQNQSSKWSFMAEAGAGILVPMGEYAAFRADARYRYDNNSSDILEAGSFGDWLVTAGIVIPIGTRAAAPVTRKYELSADALFGFDQDQLTPTGVSTMNNFANDLSQVSYNSVQVDGHTDPIGSAEYNQDLSERRADTVRTQLVSDGVTPDRITAQGFGKSQLKVTPEDCAQATSRAALIECYGPNRRVEVTVEGVVEK
jgi:OOP family OmpA-OmpF porin